MDYFKKTFYCVEKLYNILLFHYFSVLVDMKREDIDFSYSIIHQHVFIHISLQYFSTTYTRLE